MTTLDSIKPQDIADFQHTVWDFYRRHQRVMPWRTEPTPYYVLVSEMMLQQTQVTRVLAKFPSFIRHFPTVNDLAAAKLSDVIAAWSGLGYNRRAKFLWESAQKIVRDFGGEVPKNQTDLTQLPGIGQNTAGAILAYAYNEPTVFIETNIRSVYIYHFFAMTSDLVSDAELRSVIAATVPAESPRQWYWALMDYGTHLKATVGGQLHRVKQYTPQSAFEGSRRQVRGQVLKELLAHHELSEHELAGLILDDRLPEVCAALLAEGLISRRGQRLHLTDS